MTAPYVYYRISDPRALKRDASRAVRDLDWHRDLEMIRAFYARLRDTAVNPDGFDSTVGAPMAIVMDDAIVCFAIPLSFREGETEIGGVATVPEQRNRGCCKALIAEIAYRILAGGNAATLTTERDNLPMRAAAEAIGMSEVRPS